MEEIIKILIEQGIPALLGGGAVALFLIPEKRGSARLDNAERVLTRYEDLINKLQTSNNEKDVEIEALKTKIAELEKNFAKVNASLTALQLKDRENGVLRCEIIRCKNRKPKFNVDKLNELVEGDNAEE